MQTSKLRVTGLCDRGHFPAQMASNAEMFLFDDVIMARDIVVSCFVVVKVTFSFDFSSIISGPMTRVGGY